MKMTPFCRRMNQKPWFESAGMDPDHRVLVTGFEPFGNHDTNISQEVARAMRGIRNVRCPWTDRSLTIEVEVDVLTVDASGAQRTAQRIDRGARWDAILHLGLCESCTHPRVEQLAHDWLNMRIPDNNGRRVRNAALDGLGHRGCWLDLSLWDASRFPSTLTFSFDAGAYLCNETYHATLKSLCNTHHTTAMPPPALFLHLPSPECIEVSDARTFAEVCLGYMVRPYPVEVSHVVAMCLPRKDGSVLLAQRADGEADAALWEFPGGKCEANETWRASLEREIAEELALQVSAQHPLCTWYRTRDSEAYAVHLILAAQGTLDETMRLSVHQATAWENIMSSTARTWAGRDGEMFEFLNEALKPML